MAKVGDTVRYLNAVGGGKITRIEGQLAYVEEDGFETPVLLKDVVVVMPAGYERDVKGANLMFDQKAYEVGARKQEAPQPKPVKEESAPELPAVETDYGDKITLVLAFEPTDIKQLSSANFNAVLVNDSNYYLDFSFMRRSDEERGWTRVYGETLPPNEIMDLAVFTHEQLPLIERVALQAIPYKKSGEFEMKAPINVVKKLNLSKFYKFHCFRRGTYFDTPVLEFPLISEDVVAGQSADESRDVHDEIKKAAKELSQKFKIDTGRKERKASDPASNPHKLLPLIEVDLHIGELTDTTSGMKNSDMIELQISTVRKTMEAHAKRIGQKIVFIHGKGEGVLRKTVWEFLKKNYPKADLQDASFREYGFGATLVTVR